MTKQKPKNVHVDEFIDYGLAKYGTEERKEEQYARFFFSLHRFPATLQMDFSDYIGKYKLFCTYKEQRYRVTGCSRMGDIWLTSDYEQETGYEMRVFVNDCTNWSDGA